MPEKNPHFGATFAERKAARTGEKIEPLDLEALPKQTTFAERAGVVKPEDEKAVTEKKAENKAVSSASTKSRRKG